MVALDRMQAAPGVSAAQLRDALVAYDFALPDGARRADMVTHSAALLAALAAAFKNGGNDALQRAPGE